MKRSSTRNGFTLYQLIALIGLLAILAGFLAPAIQKVREAAARTQSQNNLKQIVISLHNYASVERDRFPAGTDNNHFSAHARILPYIEQNNLYRRIDFTQLCTAKANAVVRQSQVKVFISPLDPVARVGLNGPTNYFYNAGAQASLTKNDGPFHLNSSIRLTVISAQDGLSNTVALVESLKGSGKAMPLSVRRQHIELKANALQGLKPEAGVADLKAGKRIASNRGSSWLDGRFLQSTINAGRLPNDPRPDVDCGGEGGWGGPRTLYSMANVALCDGSVRSVSLKISERTWKAAMSYKDGLPLGADW